MSLCPWCHKESNHVYLKLKDYFLSQEDFEIFECEHCHLLFTNPRPTPDKIGAYYQSKNYLSHQENNHGFIPRVYEAVKSINLKNKRRLALGKATTGNLLDIGCGVGDFLHVAQLAGWKVQGIEPSDDARQIACKRLGFSPLLPSASSSITSASLDIITMWHVLEHVDDLHSQIDEIKRMLKPSGRLVLALPNYQAFDAFYYRDKWAAWDVPRHLNHFCKESLKSIFESEGFLLKDVRKLRWDAYYISYLSEKYAAHSLPLLRGAFVGLWSNFKALFTGQYSSLVYIFEKL